MYDIGEYEIYHYNDEENGDHNNGEDDEDKPVSSSKRLYRACSPHGHGPALFKYDLTHGSLATVAYSVSILALAVHILIFTGLKKLRDQPAQNLLAFSCSLFVAQLLFLTGLNYR